MFFVSLLLEQVLAWMRSQRGTTSLRAVLYMDELFGFLPPTANPPSKTPLLTLLKQARAFGLGCVLATQNPVDLDYKALSNAGTWFLGRLQTERDKARVLDGLEGVASSSGQGFDRGEIDRLLSGLDKRVFLLHNVHDSAPLLLQTRWTMSYLRGPMGRDEIRALMAPQKAAAEAQAASTAAATGATTANLPPAGRSAAPAAPAVASAPGAVADAAAPAASSRPILPPDVPQYFAPGRGHSWVPMLLGAARISYADRKLGLDETSDVVVWTPLTDGPLPVDWELAEPAPFAVGDLRREPAGGGTFAALPPPAAKARNYAAWSKAFASWAGRSQSVELLRSPSTGVVAHPGQREGDFRARVAHARREARDQAVTKLRDKYAPKLAALDERIRKAHASVEKEEQQASEQKLSTMVSVGASVLGALFGRKVASIGNLGRATTAARSVSRIGREAGDVARAKAGAEATVAQRQELAARLEEELRAVQEQWHDDAETFETVVVKPTRGGVQVQLVALVWVPE